MGERPLVTLLFEPDFPTLIPLGEPNFLVNVHIIVDEILANIHDRIPAQRYCRKGF